MTEDEDRFSANSSHGVGSNLGYPSAQDPSRGSLGEGYRGDSLHNGDGSSGGSSRGESPSAESSSRDGSSGYDSNGIEVSAAEEQRLLALHDYQVLDTSPEQAFDRLTYICARLLDVPISFVSLLDRHRVFIKSVYGADMRQIPRETSLCERVVTDMQPLIIDDASLDPRFQGVSLVSAPPYIRFYAAAPLFTYAGQCIGALCIADQVARQMPRDTLEILQQLAAVVVDELELRKANDRLRSEHARARKSSLDLARLNAELKQAKEEAELANRAKSEFLSGISHELRTPLNAVLGFAQVLEQDVEGRLSEPQARYVQQILRGGHNLLEMIDALLEVTRVESGRIEMQEQCFELTPLLYECVALLEILAEKHDVRVEVGEVKGALMVHADRSRLLQLVQNLLTNAVKYNRSGGWVTIEARSIAEVWVRIVVSDSGIGIPLERQRELFHPFSRLGRESFGADGVGVGLAVAQRLAEQMGGQISFSSEEGVGSVFWVDVPQP